MITNLPKIVKEKIIVREKPIERIKNTSEYFLQNL